MLTIDDNNSKQLKQLLKNETTIYININLEDSHTNILKILLDDEDVFSSFLKSIGDQQYANAKKESIKIQYQFNDGYQERKMDLLILYSVQNEKRAVIVENKINDAKDMDDQLKSYYEHVKNTLKRPKIKIVYLVSSRKKTPRLETVSIEALEHLYNYQAGCNPIMVFYDTARTSNIKSLYHDCFKDALKKLQSAPQKSVIKILLKEYMSFLESNYNSNLFSTEREASNQIEVLHDWLLGKRKTNNCYNTARAFVLDIEGKIFEQLPPIAYFDYKIARYVVTVDLWIDCFKNEILMELFIRRIKNEHTDNLKYHERMRYIMTAIGLSKNYTKHVYHDYEHSNSYDIQDGKYRFSYPVPSDVSKFYADLEKVKGTLSDLSENYKVQWAQNAYSIHLFEE